MKAEAKKIEEDAAAYWHTLGPGLVTGAADDDPSGNITYSQAGAQYGLGLIWTMILTYPFMATVQEMCARIGVVSGRGLAANIRHHYPRYVLYGITAILFFANTFNIAADLGAMAATTRLVMPGLAVGPLVVFFGALILFLEIYTTYARYAKYLKYLSLALLSYVAVALVVHLDWGQVMSHALVPSLSFSRGQIFLVCAILGTTISPYLFFWQTAQEVEEEVARGEKTVHARRHGNHAEAIRAMRTDVWSGMAFSNAVAFFIIAACAGTLYVHGVHDIQTADQAALALKPFGEFAFLLFTLGIVGTGLLAVPVLAGSTAYALSESFGWRVGLSRKLKQARAFYSVIIISMVLGIAANFMHLNPIKMLIYSAVANGIAAPFILYFVVKLSGNASVVGEHRNSRLTAWLGWITVVFMAVSGIAAIASLVV